MKRFFALSAAIVALLCMVSCSSSSPSSVVEKYAKAIQSEDYETAFSLFYFTTENPEAIQANKEKMIKIFERFVKPEFDKNEGIKDYKITEETISEDGTKATVLFDYIYGNGKVDDQKSRLKLVDGEWYLDSGK